jgi:predicted nucleotidyltransferase
MELSDLRHHLTRQSFEPLFATLSGAHLYGFESPDSDIDLRGAFVLPLEQVLGLRTGADTVTRTYPEAGLEMDLVCHDILKYCRLLNKRSGEVLEQLYSPLVVWPSPQLEELRELFRPHIGRDFYYHYRGFLGNQLRFIDRDDSTVKEMLYGYRVVLTGIHLLRSGQVLAHLPGLLEIYPQEGVDDLMAQKKAQHEKTPLDPAVRGRHRESLSGLEQQMEEAYQASPLPHPTGGLEELNQFVIRVRLGRS